MQNTQTQQPILISDEDFQKISNLLAHAKPEIADLLDEELGRATLIAKDELPNDVVAMNSTVSFTDLDSGKSQTITLVYPHDSNIEKNHVSILAPVGAALIGLRVGQTITWPVSPGHVRRLKVSAVAS